MRRVVFGAIGAIAWVALALEFLLTLKLYPTTVVGFIAAVGSFTSFFTIFSNALVAAVATRLALSSSTRQCDRPTAETAAATSIAVAGVFWMAFLRGTYPLSGLWLLADAMMHEVIPPTFVCAWACLLPKGALQVRDAASWLVVPVIYALWMFTRGAFTGIWPYPFLDVASLGFEKTAANSLAFLGIFWLTGLTFVGVDRALGRPRHVNGR